VWTAVLGETGDKPYVLSGQEIQDKMADLGDNREKVDNMLDDE